MPIGGDQNFRAFSLNFILFCDFCSGAGSGDDMCGLVIWGHELILIIVLGDVSLRFRCMYLVLLSCLVSVGL